MYKESDIFSRTRLLLGNEAMHCINQAKVIIFGVGGVGSWCAESLVRSGIGHLTMVDSDCVSVSNINRQLPATTATIGKPKVEVLKERLLFINPAAEINALQEIYAKETAARYSLDTYDYIIDAIDSLTNKADLILQSTRTPATLLSSMGAARKTDISRIRTAEFWHVQGCPLAAALRRKFRKGEKPAKKFHCVYSDEVLNNRGTEIQLEENTSVWDAKKKCTNGTIAHITATFGLTLSGLLVKDIIQRCQ